MIKRDQPYGRLAKILLEKQDFPDPALRTYDDTGWTMGLMLQVEVKADRRQGGPVDAAVEPVTPRWSRHGTADAPRRAAAIVVAHHGSNDDGDAALSR